MKVSRNLCDAKGCRRKATQAFDVRGAWHHNRGQPQRHYEVCAEHAAEFFPRGEDFIHVTLSERIKQGLVPS